jgi:hypothetical protein
MPRKTARLKPKSLEEKYKALFHPEKAKADQTHCLEQPTPLNVYDFATTSGSSSTAKSDA